MSSEYYPPNLKYLLNSLSGFSRMRNKLTLPFTQGRAGDTIFFKLPSNMLCDLSTLSFHFDLSTNATSSSMVPPQYTGCLIDQLSVDINGICVQQISSYAHLYKILGNWTTGDQRNRNAFLEWVGMTDTAPGATATLNNVSLAIKQWLGILGSNRIIDTNILGEITVSMRLIPNLAFISGVTTGTYTMSNMSVQFDSVNLDNPVYQQSIYRQLEQGGLRWGFQNIITNFGGASTFPVSQTFSVSTQSLDYLIGTLLQSDYATAGNVYNQVSGSSYFFNHGSTTITSANYQIGTVLIPNFRPNLQEQLSYTLDSLNLTTDVTGKSCETFKPVIGYNPALAASALTNSTQIGGYAGGNYCFAARLCHGDRSNGPLISGLSTAGTNTMVNFRVEGTSGSSFIPLVFAVCTSVLTIGAGRQIQLVI